MITLGGMTQSSACVQGNRKTDPIQNTCEADVDAKNYNGALYSCRHAAESVHATSAELCSIVPRDTGMILYGHYLWLYALAEHKTGHDSEAYHLLRQAHVIFTSIFRTTHDTQNRRDAELFLKASPTALWR